jgi:hypothetical protein
MSYARAPIFRAWRSWSLRGRVGRPIRSVLAAAIVLTSLAACGGGGGGGGAGAGPGRTASQASAWQRVLDQVGPEGQVSQGAALAAFVLAIGPLPGVPQPPGGAQEIPDGSAAVRWLLEYYSKLTPGQQSAARRLLDLGDPSVQLTSEVMGSAQSNGPLPGTPADLAAESAAAQQISSRIHYPLTIAVKIFENKQQVPGNRVDGYTIALDSNGNWDTQRPATKCTIYLNPIAHVDQITFRATMVHELFHCFEAQLAGSIGNFNRPGESWLIEGAAAWVESDLVAQNVASKTWWDLYLGSPTKPLFSRTYDALGFFGHLFAGQGVSPWSALPAMLRAGSNAAAYQATGIAAGFLGSEASVFFDNPHLGLAWWQNGNQGDPSGVAAANVPVIAEPVTQVAVSQAQTVTFSAPPYTDKIVHLRLLAPATEVTVIRGHVRLRNANGSFEEVNPAGELCTTASGKCEACPPSSASDLPPFGDAGNLAIAGGPTGAQFRVTGLTQKDVCSPPPPKAAQCPYLPAFGVLVSSDGHQDDGFYTLSCQYSTARGGGIPVGFILIETYPKPSAAEAAWKRGGISGTAQPGFSVPVLAGEADCPDCQRHEFALSGYRIYEIAESQTPGLNTLPTLDATNSWMHGLLAEG